ncbi:MAG: glutathione S-transferase family protein [Oceanicaulis sp.]|uniref:glutathione S-transferase family protein n=1 Tax=Glycocaulis sp. TaxID=1969725 RepID=UPI0025BFCD87|nr:glutathione S-transferase family protein [Glycocaulis sp.]MCC5982425.1 glutathione S-transferase family protein [Oceanicaulis sp.]MCH8520617.1 glutathione S-transferase family protein [Glycocaulis sp.]
MGRLVDGVWKDEWYDTESTGGKFERWDSVFRNWVTADGEPGPTGKGGFKAEPGRYHLYVSLACPWAHRTLIFRRIKGLEDMISLSVVHWLMKENGWTFKEGPGVIADPIHKADFMHQVYTAAEPEYSGRVTVPVLWDRKTGTIVSNESADIIRMFNSAFDGVGAKPGDYYPQALREEIDALNARIYDTVNNGVYKSGFATSQKAYEGAVTELFESLDWLEGLLGDGRKYLTGDTLTEADWRLYTTLVRFDPVYHGHFKCNLKRLTDFPHLASYARRLHGHGDVAELFNLDHAKRHYYESHDMINPTGVVSSGPLVHVADGRG